MNLEKPVTRKDCEGIQRPCPFVTCKYNTYIDIRSDGVIRLPKYDVLDSPKESSCVLDIVERNNYEPVHWEDISKYLNMYINTAFYTHSGALTKLNVVLEEEFGTSKYFVEDIDILKVWDESDNKSIQKIIYKATRKVPLTSIFEVLNCLYRHKRITRQTYVTWSNPERHTSWVSRAYLFKSTDLRRDFGIDKGKVMLVYDRFIKQGLSHIEINGETYIERCNLIYFLMFDVYAKGIMLGKIEEGTKLDKKYGLTELRASK